MRSRSYIGRSALRLLASIVCVVAIGAMMQSAFAAVVPTPSVTGPVPSEARSSPTRNFTFLATDLDLAGRGFIEEEFFYSGTANVYDTPNPFPIGAGFDTTGTANVVSANHPYKTRMVVRRPANAARFNGTVIVEWTNVTSGYDIEALWFRIHEFVLREGYAWVGISAQDNGVSGSPNGLKLWSPTRYGTLNVTDSGTVATDLLSYDIYAQAAQAIRSVPSVMGGLPVHKVIAAGVSQSAGRLSVYLNAVHTRDPVFDAALLYIGGTKVRDDLNIPVLKLLSETELAAPQVDEKPSLQPDTENIRIWMMAGTSHSDWASGIVRNGIVRRDLPNVPLYDTCDQPSRSRIQDRYVISASIVALDNWIDGVEPPHAPSLISGNPPAVVRDSRGNALGGIRLATFAVPIALDQGPNSGPGTCFLNGVHIPFDTATLQSLYPTHSAYVSHITLAANQNVADGFLLPADAAELIADANANLVGTGLVCGPLCANVRQFPLNPSAQILRDQTEFYYGRGSDQLIALVEQVTLAVAQGYTAGETTAAGEAAFAQANVFLRLYINAVQGAAQEGRLAPESAALLTDFARTLMERIVAVAQITEASITPAADGSLRIVEFMRVTSQQFFWGAELAERAVLDTGGAGGGWSRTGQAFTAWLDTPAAPAGTVPVCRFFGAAGGEVSHVFTADVAECSALKSNPLWIYEGVGFRALPLVGGACSAGFVVVNRLYKPGASLAASRHRLSVDPVRITQLVNFEGWTLEGPVFCVLP